MSTHPKGTVGAGEAIDLDQVFMLYAAFCGDVAKTAHSSDLTQGRVRELAEQYGWRDRIQSLVTLVHGEKAGDVERAINRALNFVQAHRCRNFIERVMRAIVAKAEDTDDVLELLRTERVDKEGKVVNAAYSARPLADLTTAMEKVHWMTYQALNDSPPERAKRVEKVDEDMSEADVHARISTALAHMRQQSPIAQLEEGQQELVKHLTQSQPPATPATPATVAGPTTAVSA